MYLPAAAIFAFVIEKSKMKAKLLIISSFKRKLKIKKKNIMVDMGSLRPRLKRLTY